MTLFFQIGVNFTANGQPGKVYHFNLPYRKLWKKKSFFHLLNHKGEDSFSALIPKRNRTVPPLPTLLGLPELPPQQDIKSSLKKTKSFEKDKDKIQTLETGTQIFNSESPLMSKLLTDAKFKAELPISSENDIAGKLPHTLKYILGRIKSVVTSGRKDTPNDTKHVNVTPNTRSNFNDLSFQNFPNSNFNVNNSPIFRVFSLESIKTLNASNIPNLTKIYIRPNSSSSNAEFSKNAVSSKDITKPNLAANKNKTSNQSKQLFSSHFRKFSHESVKSKFQEVPTPVINLSNTSKELISNPLPFQQPPDDFVSSQDLSLPLSQNISSSPSSASTASTNFPVPRKPTSKIHFFSSPSFESGTPKHSLVPNSVSSKIASFKYKSPNKMSKINHLPKKVFHLNGLPKRLKIYSKNSRGLWNLSRSLPLLTNEVKYFSPSDAAL